MSTMNQLTYKDGNGVSRTAPVATDATGNYINILSRDGSTATYAASAIMAAGDIDATPLDVFVIRGHATKTVRVKSVAVRVYWDNGATAIAVPIIIKKHTVANTGGTSTAVTPTKFDSNDSAPSATILQYSADPTIDATATIITVLTCGTSAADTSVAAQYDFANSAEHAIVLRGTAQELAINLGGWAGVQTGVNLAYTVVWSEETETGA